MHPEIEGLVETSNNVAIVKTHKGQAEVICHSRSSVDSALEAVKDIIAAAGEFTNAEVSFVGQYPGWEPNLQSSLLKILKDVHQKVFQVKPEVEAIHAGLECGIIGQKYPGMDMISFGPTIEHPHSPEERVKISAVENFWKFLTVCLEELA